MGAEAGSAGATIRKMRPEDAPRLARILRESPEAAQWTEQSQLEFLDSPGAVAFVSESGVEISGFIVGRQVLGEAEVLNIAVAPESRRKEEGRALLDAAVQEYRARGARRVFLEVRELNSNAIAFYQRQGFSKVGRRAGYYRNPEEAAIVMEKKLTG